MCEFRPGPCGIPCAVGSRVSGLRIVVHRRPPEWSVLSLAPLLGTNLACRVVVCLLWAYLYRFALPGATSTVRTVWLRSPVPSYRVTCRLRFLPWFLGSTLRHFCITLRRPVGTCLGYKAGGTHHPGGV